MSQDVDTLPFDPDDEPGPEDCAAAPSEASLPLDQSTAPVDDGVIALAEELQAPYEPRAEVMVLDPVDGLPRPVDTHTPEETAAPPYNQEHVVCIADARQHVSLFYDELPELDRGRYLVERDRYDRDGNEKSRRVFVPSAVTTWRGQAVVVTADGRIPVRPVRPACRHYARQLFHLSGTVSERVRHMLCVHPARRSIGGAALSLGGEAIFACDLRDPPDPQSVQRELDAFDARSLAADADKTLVPLFNLKD